MSKGTRELFRHESDCLLHEVEPAEHVIRVLALVHAARQWPPV